MARPSFKEVNKLLAFCFGFVDPYSVSRHYGRIMPHNWPIRVGVTSTINTSLIIIAADKY